MMLTLQALADIAAAHDTAMAEAMLVACVLRHYLTGEPLALAAAPAGPRAARPVEAPDPPDPGWERLVRANRDTRWNHC